MSYPWANRALLILLAAQLITGFVGLVTGAENFRWVLWLHGIGGYAVLALLLWKSAIIFDVLRRRRRRWLTLSRAGFLILTGVLVIILLTGVLWTFNGPQYVYGFSLITIHALLAVALTALLAWRVFNKWFIFRLRESRDRRSFLRMVGVALAGLALWRGAAPARAAYVFPGAKRRFTG